MTRGIVAAGDSQTAEAGALVLRAGGNAVDAVVAAGFASFVCEGPLGSPAGGGVLMHGHADRGWTVEDFFSVVPGQGLGERPELDFFGIEVDFGPTTQIFHIGRASAAVPTALFGLVDAHRDGGSLPLSDVLQPAIELARDGYVLSPSVQWVFRLLKPILTHSEGTRRLFCSGPDHISLAQPGDRLDNPALADFLVAVGRDPDTALRETFAEACVSAFGPDRGGLLCRADLDTYRPVRRDPLQVPFKEHVVLCNPPPSSGGALIGLGLRLAARGGLGDGFGSVAHLLSVASVLETVSGARRAGFDEAVLVPGAVQTMLADPAVDRLVAERAARDEERHLGGTTHISVMDGEGGAASLTVSNGEGCGTVLSELGIHMNNFLGEEDINPHGFHQAKPGTRMTTMMSPTIVLRDSEPVLVLGSGGSNRIRSVVLQALLDVLHYGVSLQDTVRAPRLHVEGRHLWFESQGLDPTTCRAIHQAWPEHAQFAEPNMFFGGVHAVRRAGGGLIGVGDPRRGGAVARA